MKRMIGIWGFFGTKNFGDDCLLQLLIRNIRQITDIPINVFSSSLTASFNERDVHCVPRDIKTSIMMAFKLDVLIIGPGGLLPNRAPGKIAFFILLALIMRLRRKKVGLFGIGIGGANFSSFISRLMLNFLFLVSSTVIVRHSLDSFDNLWKCNEKKVKTSLDYLLCNHDMFPQNSVVMRNEILFSLADIFSNKDKEREIFVDSICCVIENLLNKEIPVTLVGLTNATDSVLNQQIIHRLGNDKVSCLTYEKDNISDIVALFSRSKIVVAMRFHALVLALYNEIPTYTISYSDKLELLCLQAGLEGFMQRVCVDDKLYYEEIMRLNSLMMLDSLLEMLGECECIADDIHARMSSMKENLNKCYSNGLYELLGKDP